MPIFYEHITYKNNKKHEIILENITAMQTNIQQ